MAILIISTGGLIYDGITNVIVSYLEAMDLTKLGYICCWIFEDRTRHSKKNKGFRMSNS